MSRFDQQLFCKLCQSITEKHEKAITEFAPLVFNDIDKNGNGTLDKREVVAFANTISNDAEKTAAEMMADLDYNRDGKIQIDEWTKFWRSRAGFEA